MKIGWLTFYSICIYKKKIHEKNFRFNLFVKLMKIEKMEINEKMEFPRYDWEGLKEFIFSFETKFLQSARKLDFQEALRFSFTEFFHKFVRNKRRINLYSNIVSKCPKPSNSLQHKTFIISPFNTNLFMKISPKASAISEIINISPKNLIFHTISYMISKLNNYFPYVQQ